LCKGVDRSTRKPHLIDIKKKQANDDGIETGS